jgi:ferredoxin-fold anticodon binding domain-containing protein
MLAAGLARAQVYQSPESPGAAGRLENAISVTGKYQNYIYGVVKKVGKDEIILDKTRFGDGQVFKLDHKTKYVDNGKLSTLANLKMGDMVWIDAKIKKKTEEKIAKKVITGVGPKTVSQ